MKYIDTTPGDKNGVFSPSDYFEGMNLFEDTVGERPDELLVSRDVLYDLYTDQKFVHITDVYGGGDEQFQHFIENVDRGVGIYFGTPVKRFNDDRWNHDDRLAVLTNGTRSVEIYG